jgi:lysozyme
VCATGTTLPGVDVSTWDGTIDWNAVAASGVKFAYIRVSDGLGYPDDQFDANWANARAAGVARGVYQYFRPNQDPIAQADYLLMHMGTLQDGDLPPVIDLEVNGGLSQADVLASVHQWVDHIAAATGRAPMFYAGLYSWPSLVGSSDFAKYHLWIPQYGPVCPNLPSPWTSWLIFQNSDTGMVPGIGGPVDMDLFNGTMADLTAFAGERTVCGDGACTAGETVMGCPADCPPCASVGPLGRIVDESEECFEPGGDPVYMRHVDTAGYGGSLEWTHTTASAAASNYGIWHLTFDQAGQYRIEAYTAAPWAQSKQAKYQVTHGAAMDSFTVDQTAVDGWTKVGDVQFAAGGNQEVRLDDNTGEPGTNQVQLVFDALRLTRLDPPPPSVDGGPIVMGSDGGDGGSGGGGDHSGGCSVGGRSSHFPISAWALLLMLGTLVRRRCLTRRATRGLRGRDRGGVRMSASADDR